MKKIAILSIAALSFIACNNDDNSSLDQEKPTVEIITPTDHQEYEPGDNINIQALLTDNESLASYKIEIHSAGDGHTHSHSVSSADDHDQVEFHYEADYEINGTTYEVNQTIPIPENAEEEHYHVGIFVLDSSGNQNQQFIEIFIGHEHDHHD